MLFAADARSDFGCIECVYTAKARAHQYARYCAKNPIHPVHFFLKVEAELESKLVTEKGSSWNSFQDEL